jgi:hypothetical protein
MDDSIREILQRADDAAGTPVLGKHDLAGQVRRRARRQRRVRGMAAGLLLVFVGVFSVTAWVDRSRPQRQVAAQLTVVDPRNAQIDVKVDQLVAAILEAHEREAAPRANPQTDEFLWRLSQEKNRAGLILVKDGDRIYREFHDQLGAEASYRQVIRLFPDSSAAESARQRLSEFDAKGNES